MKNFKEWCEENNELRLLQFYENAENILRSDEIGFSSAKKVSWKCMECNR